MAKRNLLYGRDDGLGNDPLGEFSDTFNIIQFLQENDSPSDSPADQQQRLLNQQNLMNNNRGAQQQPPMQAVHQQHGYVQDPQHNTGMMYQNQSRLPDSPPITDISGAGSSVSPSSNSDAPCSPDNYGNYGVIHNNHGGVGNNNGLILGVHDLSGTSGMMSHPGMMANGQPPRGHTMPSPQSVCFMSPYPPSQATPASLPQVSPPQANQYNMMNSGYNPQAELFNILSNDPNGVSAHRKRPRLDSTGENKIVPMMQPQPMPSPGDMYGDENYNHQQVGDSDVWLSAADANKVIKFSKFQEEHWNQLLDANHQELHQLQVHVVADKGFNYSPSDGCFVNQKKNHFQISVHIEACDEKPPAFIRINNMLYPIKEFKLAFCGVKSEMVSSEIQIKQSQTDRRPIPHAPVELEIVERRMTKVTVPRLHFSETTMNNQRKNNRPNPDQKYFLLIVRLLACTESGNVALVQSYQSEKVIVRATNPGSFEPPENDVAWSRNGNTLYSTGPVAIGTDRPLPVANTAKLTVDGDLCVTGQRIQPSDIRLKEDIMAKDAREALDKICNVRVVDYFYKPEVAERWGLSEEQRKRTGVIAQELATVLPDAVRDIGDYLTVDESRVFYETVLATQELCRLTGDLDNKIDEKVEEISERLAKFARRKKMLGSIASGIGGDDSKSYLSQSRASLASTVTSFAPSKDRRRSRPSKGSFQRQDPLCNSRLTQGMIVVLVMVMAACLIAMSALYVLDWHNRNFGHHRNYQTTTQSSKDKSITEGPGLMMFGINDALPSSQPNAPPLLEHCTSEVCYSYCCSERNSNVAQHDTEEAAEMDGIALMGEHSRNVVTRSAVPPASEPVPLASGMVIHIPSLNTTLDSRYCVQNSCQKRKNRYLLYVPVSQYFPNVDLEIEFRAPNGKIVNNCGYLSNFNTQSCSIDGNGRMTETPLSTQVMDDIYELSVGKFQQSAYRFRVGYTTEACYSSEDHLHGNYEEYNLIFYRTCNQPIEAAESS